MAIPDPIQFLADRQDSSFNLPETSGRINNERALNWLPLLRRLVAGPGSSGMLASAFIKQARALRQSGAVGAEIIDLNAADDGLEAMLGEL
jgi:hypothetical protein